LLAEPFLALHELSSKLTVNCRAVWSIIRPWSWDGTRSNGPPGM